jgi:hypothetical protein
MFSEAAKSGMGVKIARQEDCLVKYQAGQPDCGCPTEEGQNHPGEEGIARRSSKRVHRVSAENLDY